VRFEFSGGSRMSRIEVVMPQMGESIAEGTIVKWHKKVGETVKKDETLLEISTDKVDSEIPSPAAGTLAEIVVPENQTVSVRTVIGYLETDGGAVAEPTAAAASAKSKEAERAAPRPEPEPQKAEPAASEAAQATSPRLAPPMQPDVPQEPSGEPRFYSPLVLNIARTERISMAELERVPGTGENGRVTKRDLLNYVAAKKQGSVGQEPAKPQAAPSQEAAAPQPRPSAPGGIVAKPADAPELRSKYPSPDYDILQMSNVLQRMAQHMVSSVQTSPHVAAVHEVDMTGIVRHRAANEAEFERREGFKLTFTPYIVDAVVKAIKKYPLINCSIEGDKIIKKNFINLGIAVASENGLIVPVIKHAEEKNFLGYARAVNDLAGRTRAKKLTPDDIQGGTFTISNYGVFGTLFGTPIINQPQVAILGTGAIKKRVAVLNDAIAIRSIAYFTLSFDHRVVDGALGGMFLEEVVQNLQGFDGNTKI
jgi:2-oxoglutarate dehydrogenase E2 component (dihydrolipoamide succinyltransferase)